VAAIPAADGLPLGPTPGGVGLLLGVLGPVAASLLLRLLLAGKVGDPRAAIPPALIVWVLRVQIPAGRGAVLA